MKKTFFTLALILVQLCTHAQKAVSYEAANWKLWFLDKPEQISITAPPTQSKAEIVAIKQAMSRLDDKKREAIRYWNAGAPSYRWNEIITDLIDKNPEVMLKLPSAWVNMSIYDATVLAWKEKLKYKRKRPYEIDATVKAVVIKPLTYSYPCEH